MADNALAEKLLSTTELSNATYGSFSRSGVRVDLKGFFESKSGQVLIHKLVAPAKGRNIHGQVPPKKSGLKKARE